VRRPGRERRVRFGLAHLISSRCRRTEQCGNGLEEAHRIQNADWGARAEGHGGDRALGRAMGLRMSGAPRPGQTRTSRPVSDRSISRHVASERGAVSAVGVAHGWSSFRAPTSLLSTFAQASRPECRILTKPAGST
jgi:hypothetical protein